jgi:Uma2 family endonuclease
MTIPVEQHFVLRGASWQTYERILEAVGDRRIRVTYDRGVLEIMTVSLLHEWWKSRLGYVVRLLAYALQIVIESYGSATMRRRDRDRGLEPDECFYIQNAIPGGGPRDIDLTRDPAPDLVIEVDVSRSWLDRVAVYAGLGVPEVWSFDGQTFRVYHLHPDGTYQVANRSLSFPALPLAEFAQFLQQTAGLNDTALVDPLCEWVRNHVPPPAAAP